MPPAIVLCSLQFHRGIAYTKYKHKLKRNVEKVQILIEMKVKYIYMLDFRITLLKTNQVMHTNQSKSLNVSFLCPTA